MRLSIIIPCLNEAAALPPLLSQLQAQQGLHPPAQIVLADGDSTDGSRELALAAGAQVVRSERGRARQMNAAARAAQGDWLLFLHADSRLTRDTQLRDALAQLRGEPRSAGHFALRFQRTRTGHEAFYRRLEHKTTLSRPGTINGDQGLLISAAYFRELGGYDESLPFLEDQRLAARIFAGGQWHLLPGLLETSARRFETEGVHVRYALMAILMSLHEIGAHEFFEQAPALYRPQDQAAALDLRPFLALARRCLRQHGRRRSWLAIGRYAAAHAWQVPHTLALRLGRDPQGWLRAHDRWLAPALRHLPALCALLPALWFYLWLPVVSRGSGMRDAERGKEQKKA